MYSCSTVGDVSGKNLQYKHRVHVSPKRSQPEITVQYLNLINHYVDILFVLPNFGTGRGLSTELGD